MGIVEIFLTGIALSADALSVTICNILANPRMSKRRMMAMPLLFGLFQGLMPVLGYYAGTLAATLVETYAGIISFCILGVVGGKMIWDAFHEDEEEQEEAARGIGLPALVLQAIATSIDAFAVGVMLCAMETNIWFASAIIASCTFVICFIALVVGRRFGGKLGMRAQIAGGIILVLIGLRALLF